MPPLLKSRSVWIACFAAWLALAFFVLARDLVMVGPQAPGLQRDELYAFLWTMVLWGAISPFIIAICEGLPLDRARLAVHTAWAFAFCVGDVLLDLVFYTALGIPHKSLLGELYDQAFINVFSYAAVAGAGYAVSYARALATNRIRSVELERRLAEARLEALTRRLQPLPRSSGSQTRRRRWRRWSRSAICCASYSRPTATRAFRCSRKSRGPSTICGSSACASTTG